MINKYRKKTINISNFREFKAKMGCYFPVTGLGREEKREIVSVLRARPCGACLQPQQQKQDSKRPSLKKGGGGLGTMVLVANLAHLTMYDKTQYASLCDGL